MRQDNANAAAEVLGNAGYEVSVATVDVSSREAVHALVETATGLGDVTGLIHAAGVSPIAGVPGDDPQGRSVWHGARAGGVRQCHRPRRRWRRHRIAVRTSPSPAHRRTEQGVGHDACGRSARPSLPSARPGDGFASRLPTLEARELAARDGRGGALGQARRADQHDQPGHHHDPARQGRIHAGRAAQATGA